MIRTVVDFLAHLFFRTYTRVIEVQGGRFVMYYSLWLWQVRLVREQRITDPELDQEWLDKCINDERSVRFFREACGDALFEGVIHPVEDWSRG